MKRTSTNNEIAHIWANRQAYPNYAENVSASSMSIDGNKLYSYSTCIGEIKELKGEKVFFLTSETYSKSTSKHVSHMVRAIPSDCVQITVQGGYIGSRSLFPHSNERENGKDIFAFSLRQAAECNVKAKRARTYAESYARQAGKWIDQAEKVNSLFNLRKKIPSLETIEVSLEKKIRADNASKRKEEKERVKRDSERLQEQIAAFRNGERFAYLHSLPPMVRVLGDVVETSHYVTIPLTIAKKACQDFRKGIVRAGYDVNGFTVISSDKKTVKIGCHSFETNEIENLCNLLLKGE